MPVTRSNPTRRWCRPMTSAVVLSIAGLGLCFSASAQQQAPRPVDQNVEDIDPLAASHRVIDPGNAQHPTRSMMVDKATMVGWTRVGTPSLDPATGQPDSRRYEYRAPGVRAEMDRPEYLVLDPFGEVSMNSLPLSDGAFLEVAPPNTVYRLIPDRPEPIDPAVLYPDWQDNRIDGRVGQPVMPVPPSPYRLSPDQTPAVQHIAPDGKTYSIRRIPTKTYRDQVDDTATPEPTTQQEEGREAEDKAEPSAEQAPAESDQASADTERESDAR